MQVTALRTVKWLCNGTKYECIKGQKVELNPSDLDKAKASKLFDIQQDVEVVEKPKKRSYKKAE